jgi:hypothetical protein
MGLHERFPIAQWIIDRLHEDEIGWDLGTYQPKIPDGLLHPSTHLGCEIEMCHDFDPDIEMKKQTTASLQRLLTGTLWHAWLAGAWLSGDWEGLEPRVEVKMGEGLPKGWQGSCDLLLGQFGDGVLSEPEWTVMDYKTVAGNGLSFINLDVPKPEQHMQISAYWHAANIMGYKLMPEVCIVHLPVSAAQYKEIEPPIEQWCKPLPQNKVFGEMKRRSQILKHYLTAGVDGDARYDPQPLPLVQKTKTPKNKPPVVVEGPSWLVKYCKSPMCMCAGQEERVISYEEPVVY